MTQIKFIGLDIHKETIAVAVVGEERASTARFYGLIPNTPDAVRRLFDRLSGPGLNCTSAMKLVAAAMGCIANCRS